MENYPKEMPRPASYGEYDFISKLSSREIKDAIKVLSHPLYSVDENTRLASLTILELELAARRSGLAHPCDPGASSES